MEIYKDDQRDFYNEVIKSVFINKMKSHAYLIETKSYEKYRDLVISFAKLLLCEKKKNYDDTCESCNICQLIDNNSYSNLKIIEPDGMWIKKEQLEELKIAFKTKSIDDSPRVYIIFKAEMLNKAAANSILKFLEEPEDRIIAILVTDNRYNILNTILSRCQLFSLKNNIVLNPDDYLNFEDSLNFIMDFERNKINFFAYINSTFNLKEKNRDDYLSLLKCMESFYDITLKYKMGKNINTKFSFYNDICYVADLNSLSDIIWKLNVIEEQKNKIKYNVNLSMLMDKLIIDLSGGVAND